MTIPAGKKRFNESFTCPSTCTATFPTRLSVFASLLHAHSHAHAMQTYANRPDFLGHLPDFAKTVSSVKAFDWHRQTFASVNFEIEAGDRLLVRCSYATRGEHSSTKFGMSNAEEMCIDFLMYYPRMADVAMCGYAGRAPADSGGGDLMYCGGAEKKAAGKGEELFHTHGPKHHGHGEYSSAEPGGDHGHEHGAG